jgi:hypothetical protein
LFDKVQETQITFPHGIDYLRYSTRPVKLKT